MNKILILTLTILAISFSSCKKTLGTKTYNMTTFGSSGVTGTITFNEAEDASTTITTYMSGTVSGKKYDMHIHSGTISAPGSVIIDLSSGTAATTTLNATKAVTNKYADMLVFDGCFVAHNFDTASTAPKYVLVGNIGKNAP